MFELPFTAATINSVTNRTEKHGDEDVPAITIVLSIRTSNAVLNLIDPTLRPTFYTRPEGQDSLPGVEESLPLLRTNSVEHLLLKGVLEGWTLVIEHGIDDTSEIEMGGCKVDKMKVVPHQGGSVDLLVRVGTSDVSPDDAGLLWSKQRQEVKASFRAPKRPEAAIDGSTAAFEADTKKDATDLFAEGAGA